MASYVGRKKLVNFGPKTKELLKCILTHPSGHFSGDYISALSGCCALKFLFTLEIDLGYLAHTPTGTWVKIQRVHINNFATNGDIITNFYPDDVSRARGDNVGTIFGWPAP